MTVLTREIIKRIMNNVGIVPPPQFGIGGLVISDLKLDQTISGLYSDGESYNFPIWSGCIEVEGVKIKAVATDLTDDIPEFILLFQSENMPIYGLRLLFDDKDNGLFLLSSSEGWVPAEIYIQAKALMGLELIASYGISWTNFKDEKLLATLSTMIYT